MAVLQPLSVRYGWRGLWLMLMGSLWIVFGLGVLADPTPRRPFVLYDEVPVVIQCAGWWITGAIAIWQGYRGPGRPDSLGHVALYLMPVVRLLSFLFSWLVYLGSKAAVSWGWGDTVTGYDRGWYAALLWSLTSAMLLVAASWPNPVPPIPRPPAGTTHG